MVETRQSTLSAAAPLLQPLRHGSVQLGHLRVVRPLADRQLGELGSYGGLLAGVEVADLGHGVGRQPVVAVAAQLCGHDTVPSVVSTVSFIAVFVYFV